MGKNPKDADDVVAYRNAVKALQRARDEVGRRLGGRAGVTISMKPIALKGDRDLYKVLEDLLEQVTKNRPKG